MLLVLLADRPIAMARRSKLPAYWPVTTPVAFTVATVVLLDVHSTF